MNRWTVCVPMQHRIDTVLSEQCHHRVLIHVHDFIVHRFAARNAFLPCLDRERDTFFYRLRAHHCLPLRVAGHGTHLLIVHIISAEGIAMAQQDVLTVEPDDNRVSKNRYAGFVGEDLANHEVAIAVHETHGHTGIDQFTQCGLHLAVIGIGVIIAEPDIKQIAQYVECFRLARFTAEETQKLLTYLGLTGLKV